MEAIRHPIFARVYEQLSRLMEGDVGEHRDEFRAGLSGRVLEGAGNGMNFAHYPPTVEEVVALEPEPRLREKAIASLVLCTVPDQASVDGSGVWPFVAGGCHCSRDTVGAIEAAGFTIERVRPFDLGASWVHANPHTLGIARAPDGNAASPT